jgi:hypothetical protein
MTFSSPGRRATYTIALLSVRTNDLKLSLQYCTPNYLPEKTDFTSKFSFARLCNKILYLFKTKQASLAKNLTVPSLPFLPVFSVG